MFFKKKETRRTAAVKSLRLSKETVAALTDAQAEAVKSGAPAGPGKSLWIVCKPKPAVLT